jgi:hypothetical protein
VTFERVCGAVGARRSTIFLLPLLRKVDDLLAPTAPQTRSRELASKDIGILWKAQLELELELQDHGAHAAFSSLLLALQCLAAACRSISESGNKLGAHRRGWKQANVHAGSTSNL